MSFKETLEKVLLVLKVLFWLVMLATAIVSFKFVLDSTDLMMDRLEAGKPPFEIGTLIEPINAQSIAETALNGVLDNEPARP